MHEDLREIITAVAEKIEELLKSLIINSLSADLGIFKGGFMFVRCERDSYLLKKNHHDSKKKIQRKEETFSQVINNP